MFSLFTSARSFNQNLAGWNVGSATSATSMDGASPPTVPVRPSCARMGGYVAQRVTVAGRLSASSAALRMVALQL
jgi:hypothetical protein